MPNPDMCESFTLTKKQVITFFQTATEVSGFVFHNRSVILPCMVEGTLSVPGRGSFHWSINAGGAGYIYRRNGIQKQYLCTKKCMAALSSAFGDG